MRRCSGWPQRYGWSGEDPRHLAAAELRNQLARRLGFAWEEVQHGLADVAGVSAECAVRDEHALGRDQ
jgi:hypothetical protein